MVNIRQAGTVNVTKIEQIKRQRRQEQENAELWYLGMVSEGKLNIVESEIALLWYEIMTGGI